MLDGTQDGSLNWLRGCSFLTIEGPNATSVIGPSAAQDRVLHDATSDIADALAPCAPHSDAEISPALRAFIEANAARLDVQLGLCFAPPHNRRRSEVTRLDGLGMRVICKACGQRNPARRQRRRDGNWTAPAQG
ncbi:hypothetical protein IVA87_23355 [Bradyrhizobium sp. 147]|uniref:hypothetical protein n=1 Tax=Bradyrhizobium sp. 147 TaxID=2782623 RepID=UPI001FF79964|nr:hypothetical protein [Bradyrhizobium sp. 147]MCK1682263.1 hypothetical protein [Bradyrhizobium sp. 147]